MRGRTHVEDLERGGRQALIVDELPYQVNKKTFVEKIAELVNEKKIEGIFVVIFGRGWDKLCGV